MDYQLATEITESPYDYTLALIDADSTKTCKICKEDKPYKDYHPNKQCVGGVVGTCRICTNKRKEIWYKANRRARQEKANTSNKTLKLKAIEYMGGICLDCKNSFPPCVMQFHHLESHTKENNPSHFRSWERMKQELDKCVMLCANCHLIRHHGGCENGDV